MKTDFENTTAQVAEQSFGAAAVTALSSLNGSSRTPKTGNSNRPKYSAETAGIIMELWMRFPVSCTDSSEDVQNKLRLLMEDVADVPCELLSAAVRQAARTCKFMPLASELYNFVREAIEHQKASNGQNLRGEQDEKSRAFNRSNAAKGKSIRWNSQMQSFIPGELGEYRACDDNTGRVIIPRFENEEHRVELQDIGAVRASYRAQGVYKCTDEGVCQHRVKNSDWS